jgi:tellurite resistance protein TerC
MLVIVWVGFVLLVLAILAFDLGLFSNSTSALTARQALIRTAAYAFLAVLFTGFIYLAYENHWFGLGQYAIDANEVSAVDLNNAEIAGAVGHDDNHAAEQLLPKSGADAAAMFFSGYLMEQSLSMDNIFIIAVILSFFKVPPPYQHRVLLWGILGALVMRGVMIGIGSVVIQQFHYIFYAFGAMLIWTAYKMMYAGEEHEDFEQNSMIKLIRRIVRVSPDFDGDKFFTKVDGKRAATPLFLALVVVELTDLLFAVDSIPAVFGITTDAFLVFTSNVFAILGLRSLYFALADLLDRFRFLQYSLVAVLGFVGVKMLLHDIPGIHGIVTPVVSLGVIIVSLAAGIGASFVFPAPPKAAGKHDHLSSRM